jgi:predicted RNA binding protein YcfA (HicA-like mRNA interferase family)
VRLGDRRPVIPRHGRKEIAAGTLRAILRQLGLEEGDL